jgi:hypothetical protein
MEIQVLKIFLMEEDINALLSRHIPADQPVREVQVRLTPEGVAIVGVYPTPFFRASFQTRWVLGLREGRLTAQLADLKVARVPPGMVRGMLLDMLVENLAPIEGMQVEDDTIVVDVERLALVNLGLTVRTHWTAIRTEMGRVVLEAAADAGTVA